jgi:hypothetical protein
MALLRGYLYIIADKTRQFAKIGMARNVRSRLQTIKTFCPLELELVDSYPCTYVRLREARVHRLLNDLRVQNEWFCWDEARIKAAINEVLLVPDEVLRGKLEKRWSEPSFHGDRPVRRLDTGEVFQTIREAAKAEFGADETLVCLAIKKAIRRKVRCGSTLWENA